MQTRQRQTQTSASQCTGDGLRLSKSKNNIFLKNLDSSTINTMKELGSNRVPPTTSEGAPLLVMVGDGDV